MLKFVQNFFRNFLRLRRNPVVKTNILLISPFFDAEQQRFGDVLVKNVLGEAATFTRTDADGDGLVEMPLGKRKKGSVPLLYSLPAGFQEIDADGTTRALLGLSSCQPQPRLEKAFVDRLRPADAVCVVCLNLAMTPLPYASLAQDLPALRKTFLNNRLLFVGINGDKLRSWNPKSQRTRMHKWRALIGDTNFIECALDAEGISDVLKAVSNVSSARATQPNRHISDHIFN